MTTSEDSRGTAKRNKILAGAATVAVLAVVLFAVGSLSPIKLPDRNNQGSAVSTQFVQRAEEALKSGDTTLAAQLASKAVDAAPTSVAAKQIQAKVKAAVQEAEKSNGSSTSGKQTGGATKGTGGTTDTGGTAKGGGSVANTDFSAADPGKFASRGLDLEPLVPKQFVGYDITGAWKADGEVQKTAISLDPRSTVENLIWTVREMKDADHAKSFIKRTSRVLYKHDAQVVKVDGVNAYFGTDGERYATCAYVRGVYVFELLGTSRNVKPAEIKPDAVTAAQAFTDTVGN